jgi:hypothetical protein
MIEGGVIQATSRQLTVLRGTWVAAAVAAATVEMPTFAAAPAAGDDETSRMTGSRIVPSIRPMLVPRSATTKHQAATAVIAAHASTGSGRYRLCYAATRFR